MQKGALNGALTDFMSELAKYLVAAGVNGPGFAEIVRVAFYRAAAEDARFRNRRVNQSAVAAMTGLTRAQIRTYSQQKVPIPRTQRDRVTNIVRGWTTDPIFLTPSDIPKRLSFGTRNSAFTLLAHKYGGDVSPRSMLREMVRKRYVTVQGRRVSLHSRARRTVGQTRLESLTQSLIRLLHDTRSGAQRRSTIQTLNDEILFPATSRKGRILLQKRSVQSLRALMVDLHAAGNAAAIESPPATANAERSTRVRVVLIAEDGNFAELKYKAGR